MYIKFCNFSRSHLSHYMIQVSVLLSGSTPILTGVTRCLRYVTVILTIVPIDTLNCSTKILCIPSRSRLQGFCEDLA